MPEQRNARLRAFRHADARRQVPYYLVPAVVHRDAPDVKAHRERLPRLQLRRALVVERDDRMNRVDAHRVRRARADFRGGAGGAQVHPGQRGEVRLPFVQFHRNVERDQGWRDLPDGHFRERGKRGRPEGFGLAAVDRDGRDPVAERRGPLGRKPLRAAHDPENRAERRRRAIGVVAAVGCDEQGFPEIAFAVEPADDDKADVRRRLEPADRRHAVVHHSRARLLPGKPAVVRLFGNPHRARDERFGRNPGQPDPYELADTADDERGAFNGRREELGVHALGNAVVHRGVLVGQADRRVGRAGKQARPYLRPDPGPVRILQDVVHIRAGHGRQQPRAEVHLGNAVFAPGRRNVVYPVFAEKLRGDVLNPAFNDRLEPYELQVQVVVRERLPGGRRVAGHVQDLAPAFERAAEGSADVLADPAPVDPVGIFAAVQHYLLHVISHDWPGKACRVAEAIPASLVFVSGSIRCRQPIRMARTGARRSAWVARRILPFS